MNMAGASLDTTFLAMIFSMANKTAPMMATNSPASKVPKAGSAMRKTPMYPTMTETQWRQVDFSFRKIMAKAMAQRDWEKFRALASANSMC